MTQFKEITLEMPLAEIVNTIRPGLRINHLWQLKSGMWGAQMRGVGDGRFYKFGWGPGPEIALTEALKHGVAGIQATFLPRPGSTEVVAGAWPDEFVPDSDRVMFGVPYDRAPGDLIEHTDPTYSAAVDHDDDIDELLG